MNYKTTHDTFNIRQATLDDVSALASLHVQTFNETHGAFPNSPTCELRQHQWQQILQEENPNHFCLVLENAGKQLIGFARGIPYDHPEHGSFKGELNKIYLLKKYHRLGLGKRLLCSAAEKFISGDIFSMVLFGDANNPSNHFYEAMGAEKLLAKDGSFHGGYGWNDLRKLVEICAAK